MARRKQTKVTVWGTVAVIVAAVVLKGLDSNFNFSGQQDSKSNYATTQPVKDVDYGTVTDTHPSEKLASSVLTKAVKSQLKATSIRFNGSGSFILNDDKNSLNANVSSAPYVKLSKQDVEQRPGQANAWLTKAGRQYQNRQETGNAKTMKPVGWQQLTIKGRYQVLYNRGHSIGYALAGNIRGFDASEANPQNITTQTSWANQASNGDSQNTGQNYYETLVRQALDANKKVRYQVTPIYDEDDLVPSGSQIKAKSSDGSLEFNVFVPNVEPGVAIDYATGAAKLVN